MFIVHGDPSLIGRLYDPRVPNYPGASADMPVFWGRMTKAMFQTLGFGSNTQYSGHFLVRNYPFSQIWSSIWFNNLEPILLKVLSPLHTCLLQRLSMSRMLAVEGQHAVGQTDVFADAHRRILALGSADT